MTERLAQKNPEMQSLTIKRLWKEVQVENQKTEEVRRASKALRFYASLTQTADSIVDGKVNPLFTFAGMAAIALTPYILNRLELEIPSVLVSDFFAGVGFAALAERELRIGSKSEKSVNRWVNNWILNIKKTTIDSEDVSKILLELPKTSVKSPEEIRGWLKKGNNPENTKDPYLLVAKSVRGIVAVENRYADLNPRQKKRREIGDTVILMMGGQIKAQKILRSEKRIRKEGGIMTGNAAIGALAGVLLSTLVGNSFGSEWGGPLGLIDDFVAMFPILKNRVGRAINKIKFSAGLEILQEKQRKINASMPNSSSISKVV